MTPELFMERAEFWLTAAEGGGMLKCHRAGVTGWETLVPNPNMPPEAVAHVLAADLYEVRLFPMPTVPPR